MCADSNFVSNVIRTKKLPLFPSKIGNFFKHNRHRKLKWIAEIKKRMKMKKELPDEIRKLPPFLKAQLNRNTGIKSLRKSTPENIYTTVKRGKILAQTSFVKKTNTKINNELGKLKFADGKEVNVSTLNIGDWQTREASLDDVFPDSNFQNETAYENFLNQNCAMNGNVNARTVHLFSEIGENNCSIYSEKCNENGLENVCQKNFNPSSNNQNIIPCKGVKNIISLEKKKNARAEFHQLSGKCYLLILRHPCQIHFRGTLSVTPVSGRTSFLGFEFAPGMKSHLIFSPRGISPLCLATTGHTCYNSEVPKIFGFDKNILKRLGKNDSAILIEPASGEHWSKLFGLFSRVLKFNPLSQNHKEVGDMCTGLDVENNLGVKFVQPGSYISSISLHSESIEWEKLAQEIQSFNHRKGQVRLMVFGGKGVGKSTFMRFLINRWLSADKNKNKTEQSNDNNGAILFIDFDPGQSEFVPPGCLSVTLVSKPLLGPNYTHLKEPERMICVGDLDVGKCPKWYLQCANDLVEFCSSLKELRKLPWFVNTMGFCRGIGADLAVELIRLCHPTHVIQVKSCWSRRNFHPINLLSWSLVNSWKGQDWCAEIVNLKAASIPEYSFYQLQSLAERPIIPGETNKINSVKSNFVSEDGVVTNEAEEMEDTDSQWGIPAWQSRDFCVLAYFSRMVSEPKFSILKPKPCMLKLSDVILSLPSSLVKPHYITSVFNGRLVALCSVLDRVKKSTSPEHNIACNSEEINQVSSLRKKGSKKPWEKVLTPSDTSCSKILFHMPLAPCLGFGIVRGIDNCSRELYLNTPLDNETLASINCLATSPSMGSLPKPLIFEAVKMRKDKFIPYVVLKDSSNPFSRTTPRVFQPLITNPNVKL